MIRALVRPVWRAAECLAWEWSGKRRVRDHGFPRHLAPGTSVVGGVQNGSKCHFVTRNTTLLLSVFLVVFTSTVPVVAPEGTLVLISDFDMTVNFAAVPLKVTLVAPVRFVPRILTAAPTLPEVGTASVAVGDVNGDGRPDLLVLHYQHCQPPAARDRGIHYCRWPSRLSVASRLFSASRLPFHAESFHSHIQRFCCSALPTSL